MKKRREGEIEGVRERERPQKLFCFNCRLVVTDLTTTTTTTTTKKTMLACNPCAVSNGRPPPPSFPPLPNFFSSRQNEGGGRQNTFGRGEKRKKKESNNDGHSDVQTTEKRRATEEKVTTATIESGFAAKVKHFLPTHVVSNNNNRSSTTTSYSRMWKRRRKVSDDSVLNDVTKNNDAIQKLLPEAETEQSAKNKLLTIVQNDRMSTRAEEIQVLEDDKCVDVADEQSVKPKTSSGGFFLQRGNHLISSVRSSLRKMGGYAPHKRRSNDVTNVATNDVINVDVVEELTCLKLEDANSNDSQVNIDYIN